MSSASVGMSDLSDEIMLCILRHVPVCDLLTNVANVCQKLHRLCYDKTLLTHVRLSEEYWVKQFKIFVLSFEMMTKNFSVLIMFNVYKITCKTYRIAYTFFGNVHAGVQLLQNLF